MGNISKHFNRDEFSCQCGCGFDTVDAILIRVLEGIRQHFDKPIIITGPNRCEVHNKLVGGATKSMHLTGKAVDFKVVGIHADIVYAHIDGLYPDTYGIGHAQSFIHLDVRNDKARWTY